MPFKHSWQTCVALLGVIQLARCANLIFYRNDDASLQNHVSYPLTVAPVIMTDPSFSKDRPTAIVMVGFTGVPTNPAPVAMLTALILQKKYNVMQLDYSLEASAISISTQTDPETKQISYVLTGVEGAISVAIQLAVTLLAMIKLGLNIATTYLLGFSLGGQLAGITGRTLKAAGQILGWIIALDPAGPLWGTPPTGLPSVGSGDANTVNCFHCDPGYYGINSTSKCDADAVYNPDPYYEPIAEEQVQPGCPIPRNFMKFTNPDLCSHNRCWGYFAERKPISITASRSLDGTFWSWKRGLRDCSDNITIGMDFSRTKKGVYFGYTNSASIFGLGAAGACP